MVNCCIVTFKMENVVERNISVLEYIKKINTLNQTRNQILNSNSFPIGSVVLLINAAFLFQNMVFQPFALIPFLYAKINCRYYNSWFSTFGYSSFGVGKCRYFNLSGCDLACDLGPMAWWL